jgi:hypothetical protein
MGTGSYRFTRCDGSEAYSGSQRLFQELEHTLGREQSQDAAATNRVQRSIVLGVGPTGQLCNRGTDVHIKLCALRGDPLRLKFEDAKAQGKMLAGRSPLRPTGGEFSGVSDSQGFAKRVRFIPLDAGCCGAQKFTGEGKHPYGRNGLAIVVPPDLVYYGPWNSNPMLS